MSINSVNGSTTHIPRFLQRDTSTPALLAKAAPAAFLSSSTGSSVAVAPTTATGATSTTAASATTTTTSGNGTATISDAAKAANDALAKYGLAGQSDAFSQTFFDKINSLSTNDKLDAYTQAANEVSAQQNLAQGQYDFSQMTRGQATVVVNYLALSGKATPTEVAGLTSAMDAKFGSSNQWTAQTFDVGKLVKNAASDAGIRREDVSSYNNALSMIRRMDALRQHDTVAQTVDINNWTSNPALPDASGQLVGYA